ncbi:hypothetical protein NOVA_29050 [Nocardia nova]|nr:hypothetical protein [Nocardia nova]
MTEDERAQLQAWARRRITAQAVALRARTVIACEGDLSNTAIARELGVSRSSVTKWRNQVRHRSARRVAGRTSTGQAAHDR